MLNENGVVVFIGGIETSFYTFGDRRFKLPTYSKDECYWLYKKHGLKIEYFDVFENKQPASNDGNLDMAVARKSVD